MEKEEEGRMKDKTISALETQIHDLMTQLSSADRERSTLRVSDDAAMQHQRVVGHVNIYLDVMPCSGVEH